MFSVYQHWDPLKVCVVGRSYPPEFYSWITVPHVRNLFEKIAIETEEDYQNIIAKLLEFGVEILRPDIPSETTRHGQYVPPPMTPRDNMIMIGNKFYENFGFRVSLINFYRDVKDPSWPDIENEQDFFSLPQWIQQECITVHQFPTEIQYKKFDVDAYAKIFNRIRQQGNEIRSAVDPGINGAMVSRIGKDLYFGTTTKEQNTDQLQQVVDREFKNYRSHIVNTGGHSDGSYCPVCPGLIVSLGDISNYNNTFPDWEVVYLPNQSWAAVQPFLDLKARNQGRWWIPGFEHDAAVIDTVETWLGHWTGYVEETVFDVNMLIIDPKNVIVFNYNEQVFNALHRYSITPHVVPFRHRYFWDGGIHCVTADLHREGTMQDYFSYRN